MYSVLFFLTFVQLFILFEQSTRKCTWERYEGMREVRDTISQKRALGRKIGGSLGANQLVENYLKHRREEQRQYAHEHRLSTPEGIN